MFISTKLREARPRSVTYVLDHEISYSTVNIEALRRELRSIPLASRLECVSLGHFAQKIIV